MSKQLFAAIAFAALSAPVAFADSQTLTPGNFSQIRAEAAMNVVWRPGPSVSARLESGGSDFSDADIRVDAGTLIATRQSVAKRGWFRWGAASIEVSEDGKRVKVNGKSVPAYTLYVTSPALQGAQASQSSRVEATGIDVTAFTAGASSSGTIILAGRAGAATLSASSSGALNAGALETSTLEVSASSSGDVGAATTGAGEVEVSASSSGEVELTSSGPAVFTVSASSGGAARLSGACGALTVSASSGANVSAGDLACRSVRVSASSGASIDAYASEAAAASASSGGDITVLGNPPAKDTSRSSGGDVTFAS